MLDELLAVRIIPTPERACMCPDHRFAQGMMQHRQQEESAFRRAVQRADQIIRAVPAAGHHDVALVVSVAGFERENGKDDLRAVEFGQALGAAELVELPIGGGAADDIAALSSAFRAVRYAKHTGKRRAMSAGWISRAVVRAAWTIS